MSGADTNTKRANSGTFDSERAKAAAAKRGKGKRAAKGIAGDVRKHRKAIVAGLLELATKGTATAKARALSELARIGWGNPASAAEMGAIEPVASYANPRDGGADPFYGQRGPVVVLPAEDRDDVMAALERLAEDGRREEAEKRARLTAEELAQLERLEAIMDGRVLRTSPAIASTVAPSESPAETPTAPPEPAPDATAALKRAMDEPFAPPPATSVIVPEMKPPESYPGESLADYYWRWANQ